MDKPQIHSILREITKEPKAEYHEENNLRCLKNLLTILDMEQDITTNLSQDTVLLLQRAIVASTPFRLGISGAILVMSKKDEENIMKSVLLLQSRLMAALSETQRKDLEKGIIWFINDLLEFHWGQYPPLFPANFSLLKLILDTPHLQKLFLGYCNHYLPSVMVWALEHDTSFLAYVRTEAFSKFFVEGVDKFHTGTEGNALREILGNYLAEKEIDRALFWNMVNSLPDIPAFSVLELLSN